MPHKFYLSFGRHERYGSDTAIEREDMLSAFLTGQQLKLCLPTCATIYHSPIERAAQTARFEALGMNVSHLLCVESLIENSTKFEIHKFITELLCHTESNVEYYHFVTHLPVIEKLGLPFLGAGEVCLLTADNKNEMLAENFQLQIIKKPEITAEVWRQLCLTSKTLEHMSADEIYQKISLSNL